MHIVLEYPTSSTRELPPSLFPFPYVFDFRSYVERCFSVRSVLNALFSWEAFPAFGIPPVLESLNYPWGLGLLVVFLKDGFFGFHPNTRVIPSKLKEYLSRYPFPKRRVFAYTGYIPFCQEDLNYYLPTLHLAAIYGSDRFLVFWPGSSLPLRTLFDFIFVDSFFSPFPLYSSYYSNYYSYRYVYFTWQHFECSERFFIPMQVFCDGEGLEIEYYNPFFYSYRMRIPFRAILFPFVFFFFLFLSEQDTELAITAVTSKGVYSDYCGQFVSTTVDLSFFDSLDFKRWPPTKLVLQVPFFIDPDEYVVFDLEEEEEGE
ncbi:MAG: hypothetical protein QXT86_08915 [Archaeoglobaceae archaeon]